MPSQWPSRIAEILVKNGVVGELQLRTATAQIERWGGRLAHVLAETGLANEDRIVDTLARALRIERIRLANIGHVPAVQRIDEDFAEKKAIFPVYFKDDGKVLVVAMADPLDLDTINEIQRRVRARVTPCIASEREIQAAISRHYRGHESAASGHANTAGARMAEGDREASPPPVALPPPAPAGGQSAARLLSEILGDARPPGAFTEQDMRRLQTVQSNQQKSELILRAVMALLMEKGYLTPQELSGRFEPSWH